MAHNGVWVSVQGRAGHKHHALKLILIALNSAQQNYTNKKRKLQHNYTIKKRMLVYLIGPPRVRSVTNSGAHRLLELHSTRRNQLSLVVRWDRAFNKLRGGQQTNKVTQPS